jgi:hypothetical protein
LLQPIKIINQSLCSTFLSAYGICYFRKNPQKSLGEAPTCKMSMARTSANYIGPFSTNSLISMLPPPKMKVMGKICACGACTPASGALVRRVRQPELLLRGVYACQWCACKAGTPARAAPAGRVRLPVMRLGWSRK